MHRIWCFRVSTRQLTNGEYPKTKCSSACEIQATGHASNSYPRPLPDFLFKRLHTKWQNRGHIRKRTRICCCSFLVSELSRTSRGPRSMQSSKPIRQYACALMKPYTYLKIWPHNQRLIPDETRVWFYLFTESEWCQDSSVIKMRKFLNLRVHETQEYQEKYEKIDTPV